MKHFRLTLFCLLAVIVASSVITTICLSSGRIPQGILAILSGVLSITWLTVLIRNLIRTMTALSNAMEAGDTSVRFPKSDDRMLDSLAESMNTILRLYHDSMAELETGKLYYDRILRVITHEIRNSLTPVISVSKDVLNHPSRYDREGISEVMGMVYSQSSGMKQFLDSYYRLTHLPKPGIETIRLDSFFSDIRDSIRFTWEELGIPSGNVIFTIPLNMTVYADRDLLGKAVTNLVKNALEAVNGRENPTVHIIASISGENTFISVADNGPGIDANTKEMLFQPFFTTKQGGCGIGLCLSRQIARLHGGDLSVSSIPGEGATFTILLPKNHIPQVSPEAI